MESHRENAISNHNTAYVPPNTYEDLPLGIKYVTNWLTGSWLTVEQRNKLVMWVYDAQKLLASIQAPVFHGPPPAPPVMPGGGYFSMVIPGGFGDLSGWLPPEPAPDTKRSDGKLPPMNCIKCSHRNEYVGPEHLAKDGTYTCRTCKGDK